MSKEEEKYNILDCIYISKDCPCCGERIDGLKITDFESLHMSKGLIYRCPKCKKRLVMTDLVLEEQDNA